jgi:hypothetical protein
MSTSLVHVLTVIGKGATQVEAACEELRGRRVERDPQLYGSDDWSERDHRDIDDLCVALLRASRKLPVYYYAQYLDSWSIGRSMYRLLDWPDGMKRLILGSAFSLVFYPSRYSQEFLAQIKRRRRTKLYRNQREDRWYLDQVKEAFESALWLEDNFIVVSIDECIEPSRYDDEIKAALESPIDLTESKSSPANARNTGSRGSLRVDL